ncbi:glycosyltransferase family 4 protein [Alteromonadaceae bacterium A_SAG1]|nr:glycosyltransferase family 4 protein [Alteromonadaceae bacterium A_SAG1]
MTLRVTLLPEHFNWAGGFDFLRHILNGLASISSKYNVEISIAVKQELAVSELYSQLLDYLTQSHLSSIKTFIYQTIKTDFVDLLNQHNIDIVMPVNADLGADFPLPWVSYIPDFQHRYLFLNFTESECFSRETAFVARLRDCKTMLVNSNAVKDDIVHFYPWVNPERIFSLPYSPHPLPEWLNLDSEHVREKYSVGSRYFMICNQFWLHKDHKTAFTAFASLKRSDLQLVCTGNVNDYRRPEYLDELLEWASELRISNQLLLLGHIPKLDQIALLGGSLALLQPTLFEGGPGGGAVYDAISIGKPVILSDIKVNQEVMSEDLTYFKAGDAEQLANAMVTQLSGSPKPSTDTLINNGIKNQQKLGEALYDIIQKTLAYYK